MLFLLPLIVVPLLTLLFWSQGGGQGMHKKDTAGAGSGINMRLPDANNEKGEANKLTLYQLALKDSQQLAEQRRSDPYSATLQQNALTSQSYNATLDTESGYHLTQPAYNTRSGQDIDKSEQKVRSRLAELNRQLAQPTDYTPEYSLPDTEASVLGLQNKSGRPSALNAAYTKEDSDPELDKMNNMLEKIYAIQHPETVRAKLQAESNKNKGWVYPVGLPKVSMIDERLIPARTTSGSEDNAIQPAKPRKVAFYGLNSNISMDKSENKAVAAVVSETETLVSGATAKLRLTEDIMVNGLLIPQGTFVYGSCQLQGERLTIDIRDIRYRDHILPVAMTVYDLDGLNGIKIPGAITRDAIKEGMDQGIQGMNILSMDPSIGAQAATAGIQATKSLLSRKARLVKCTVKAGYPVLLVDTKKQNKGG